MAQDLFVVLKTIRILKITIVYVVYSYSVDVIKYHDGSNFELILAIAPDRQSPLGQESMAQHSGREGSCLLTSDTRSKEQIRVERGYTSSKPAPSDILPPARPQFPRFYNLLKQHHQTYKSA